MNRTERLEAIKEHNQLCAAVAEVTAEQKLSKETKKKKKGKNSSGQETKNDKEDTI